MKKGIQIFMYACTLFLAGCMVDESSVIDDVLAGSDDQPVQEGAAVSDSGGSDKNASEGIFDNESGTGSDSDTYDPTKDPEWQKGDTDGDGIPNGVEGTGDTDGDGLPDYLDSDSDNDDLADSVEAGADGSTPADTDSDKVPDYVDKDSDNDGLSDREEVKLGTDPLAKDTDKDGSDDLAEIAYGSDPLDDSSNIPEGIFYVVLPYNAPDQVTRTLTFSTKIESIDVQIVLDISGSMNDEIAQVSEGIKTKIIDPVALAFPQKDFASFGVSRISWNGTSKFLRQQQTFSVDEVKSAVDNIASDALNPSVGGNELHSEVLYQLAAGEEFHGTAKFCPKGIGCGFLGDAVVNIAPADCTGEIGTVGHACFRKKTMPIYIEITDELHEDCDPDGKQLKSECFWVAGTGFQNGHTFKESIAVMNGIGAKFIGINTWHEKTADGESNPGIDPEPDMQMMAEYTGSLDKNGKPFIYHTSTPTGEGMPDQIAQAIKDLITFIDMDVTTGKMSDENCDGKSAADFVKSSTTISADPADGVAGQDASSFFSVKQGTTVTFDVKFHNDFCKNQTDKPLVFKAYVTVLGNGAYLSSRLVHVVIPEIDPE